MAAEGEGAYEHMMRVAEKFKGKFIFAVEGAVPVAHDGKCCVVAEADHHEVTMTEVTKVLAANAAAVLAVGTCAAYGGIPAGKGNETGAMGVSAFLKKEGIATNTRGLLVKQGLDANGRPKAFYKNVHMNCPHLSAFEAGHMVKTMSDKDGCRFSMGCKGPRSACDSFERKWNNGVNWCVNNATCIGCTSPTFPDGQSPFYVN